jgi:hypothetical protein
VVFKESSISVLGPPLASVGSMGVKVSVSFGDTPGLKKLLKNALKSSIRAALTTPKIQIENITKNFMITLNGKIH